MNQTDSNINTHKNDSFMRRLLISLVVLMVCTLSGAQMAKYQALYLFQFAKNTSWPIEDNGKDFVITVIGDNSLASELKSIVSNKKLGNRSITVLESAKPTGLTKSDIVYLGESKSSQISSLINAQKGNKVLIVSGSKGQCAQGAGISFLQDGATLKFEISESNIGKFGLKVTPNLVSLGTAVF